MYSTCIAGDKPAFQMLSKVEAASSRFFGSEKNLEI